MNAYQLGRYSGSRKSASWRTSLLVLPKFKNLLKSLVNPETVKKIYGSPSRRMAGSVRRDIIERGNRLFNLPIKPVATRLRSGRDMIDMSQVAANRLTDALIEAPSATAKDKLKALLHTVLTGG